MENISISDRRGFSIIENACIESFSLVALGVYCHLVSFAGNQERKAYISISSIAKQYQIGREKVRAAIEELIEYGAIIPAGTTEVGAPCFTLVHMSRGGGSDRPGGWPNQAGGVAQIGHNKIKTNNKNNNKKETQPPKAAKQTDVCLSVIEKYNSVFGKKIKPTPERMTKIRATLRHHSHEDLLNAIDGMAKDDWTKKSGRNEIERLIDAGKRDRNIEMFSKVKPESTYDYEAEMKKKIQRVNEKIRGET